MFKRLPRHDHQKSSSTPEQFLSQPSKRLLQPILVMLAGWRPMSAIHLDELHSLLVGEIKPVGSDQSQLIEQLKLRSVSREVSFLEYIRLATQKGVEVKLYQDGLAVLSTTDTYLDAAEQRLLQFMTDAWEPLLASMWPEDLRNQTTLTKPQPLVIAEPWVHDASSPFLADLGELKGDQKDGQVEVITTSTQTVVVAPRQNTELLDLIEMHLYCREIQHQARLLLKQARSIQQSNRRFEQSAAIQPSQLAHHFNRVAQDQQRVSQSKFWLGEIEKSVIARQKIAKNIGVEQTLENLFFHSPGSLQTAIESIQAHYDLLSHTLAEQLKQFSWWQRHSTGRRTGLTQTFLVTLTVLFIGYICFGPDKLRVDNGGGLVLTLLVVGSLILSLIFSLLFSHQEYWRRE